MRDYVLIVEDDADLAEALQLILELHGYRATLAGNGRDALAMVAACMPSLIVLDMLMPVMDGWQFAREFARRHGREAPILVVTAAENARERASEIGADDVLGKPFEISALVAKVQRLTAGSARVPAEERVR